MQTGKNALPFLRAGASHDLGALAMYGRRAAVPAGAFQKGLAMILQSFARLFP